MRKGIKSEIIIIIKEPVCVSTSVIITIISALKSSVLLSRGRSAELEKEEEVTTMYYNEIMCSVRVVRW